MENEKFVNPILIHVAVILSFICLILINILLSDKISNSSKLMRYICLSEALFTFSEYIIIMNYQQLTDFSFMCVNLLLINT